jgi:hypothetical protein
LAGRLQNRRSAAHGRALDEISVAGFGTVRATLLDVSNPLVVVKAEEIGLTGREMRENWRKTVRHAMCWRPFAALPPAKWVWHPRQRTPQKTRRHP